MKKRADFNFPCQPGFPSRMLTSVLATTAGLVALAALTTGAQAANPDYCHNYARSAVAQYRAYLSIPGCFKESNVRWHPDYGAHNFWCLSVSIDAAEQDRHDRSDVLDECRARAE